MVSGVPVTLYTFAVPRRGPRTCFDTERIDPYRETIRSAELRRGTRLSFGWCLRIVALVAVVTAPLFAQEQQPSRAQSSPASSWQPARLSDGQPDVQGVWGAVLAGAFSLTNPMTGGDDFAQRLGGPPIRRPSRIVDPADGRVPYQPWAAALQEHQASAWEHATRPWEIDTQSRCLLSIAPRLALLPTPFRIIQAPASVVFIWDDYHAYRVVPLDGRPHIGATAKLWMGDARGHWEGNTLVIDTTNVNGKGRLSVVGDFLSAQAHITERLTFADADTMTYETTIDDPAVFTRPWTMRAVEKRKAEYEFWENACHEGERSVEGMLLAK